MSLKAVESLTERDTQPHDGPESGRQLPQVQPVPVWLTPAQARDYVGNSTLAAWYQWRKAHGIVSRVDGTVSRLDIDKERKRPAGPCRVSEASLANLLKSRRRSR